ncbi:F-box protein PP2-B15 [Citrus sinensis]|nr:F-box protein PP2-B15 [Citrus sinensis]
MNVDLLPEDCFAHILSYTSPRDACRLSLVSSTVRFAADSDNVWQKFLPVDYQEILSRLVLPLVYISKKELFMRLCSPVLIDQGGGTNMKFSLKFIFVPPPVDSNSALEIAAFARINFFSQNNSLWPRSSTSASSRKMKTLIFTEVAELRTISWLQITGKINTKTISPKTQYAAYLIVKFAERAFGLDSLPSEVSLEVGNGSFKSQGTVYLRWQERKKQLECLGHLYFLHRDEALRSRVSEGDGERFAREREDGWIEIELGSFYNDGGEGKEVKMCLKEVKGQHLKGGLIVEGIEIRPKE